MTRTSGPDVLDEPAPGAGASPVRLRLARGIPVFAILAVAVLALLAGGFGSSYQGKLSEVQKNDNSSYLPASAESTKAGNISAEFNKTQSLPGFLVFQRAGGLTAADRTAVTAAYASAVKAPGVDAQAATPPVFSADGTDLVTVSSGT
jgi:RND superfamily putative drug exporter